ncbi:MAG: universal stress protein [Bacteroidales bacterium]
MYSILVPVDFTPKSVWALSLAAGLARKNEGIVHLLHVIDSFTNPGKKEIDNARLKLFDFAKQYQNDMQVSVIPNVETGSIFTTIGEMGTRLGVKMIIMGTVGLKGIQRITGSFALRIILGSKTPVLLLQKNIEVENIKNIVIPFDLSLPMENIVKNAIRTGLLNQSKVYVYGIMQEKSFFYKRKMYATLQEIIQKLENAGLAYSVDLFQNKYQNLTDAILKYASSLGPAAIAFPVLHNIGPNSRQIPDIASNLVRYSSLPLLGVNPIKQ